MATRPTPHTSVAGPATDEDLLLMAAALSWAAAIIHGVVTPAHFGEWWVFGVLFVIVGTFQALWGARVYVAPRRGLLLAGAVVNVGVAAVWAISRITGLPAGPEPWQPEAVGFIDVMATLDELIIAAIAVAMLRGLRPPRQATWLVFYPVIVISVLSALLGSHHQ